MKTRENTKGSRKEICIYKAYTYIIRTYTIKKEEEVDEEVKSSGDLVSSVDLRSRPSRFKKLISPRDTLERELLRIGMAVDSRDNSMRMEQSKVEEC